MQAASDCVQYDAVAWLESQCQAMAVLSLHLPLIVYECSGKMLKR